MSDVLDQVQLRLHYTFRDRELLECALTHPSYLPEHPDVLESNQRLEFLGDAVLQLVLTEALFAIFPEDREGQLSKRRAALTRGAYLSRLSAELGLASALRLGTSEETGGGREKASLLEDAFEAVIGALYLDSDLPTVRQLVLGIYGDLTIHLARVEDFENPKGRLQELVQPVHGNNAVRYEVAQIFGQDHAREYEIAVFLLDRPLGTGRGSSKKLAEEAAARVALEALKSL